MVGAGGLGRRVATVYLPLALFLVFLLFPFYWMLVVSLKPTTDVFNMALNPFGIRHLTGANFAYLFRQTAFLAWAKNTLVVSTAATVLALACSVLIGYALARLRFRAGGPMGIAIFLAYLVPPTLLFLPLAQLVGALHLYNTYWALILTYPTFLIPFGSWLLMGYFRTIPHEIEECALIDGSSRIGTLLRIVLPLSIPGLLSAGIFSFTLSWNEFLYALIFMSSGSLKTIPVGTVSDLIRADVLFWGPLMASALLGSVPIAVIYTFFVDHYVTGLTAGSVKG